MRALVLDRFRQPGEVRDVPDPTCPADGVVVRVGATGLCRSDWHAWMGHDDTVVLPHVPGHELAGTVVEVGPGVRRSAVGDRVTVPFVCACGTCPTCLAGDQQVCDRQVQPGFTSWGSFAELVALEHADVNLVPLPADVDLVAAVSLGCRFATAYRALSVHGRVGEGQWVAVHGCGGVGLSAVMIAAALGAQVVAVDVSPAALAMATSFGAAVAVDARDGDPAQAVRDATGGGAHVSLDALGSEATCRASILGLRKRGRHVQVGLLLAAQSAPPLPMDRVVAWELEIYGSHGMAAHAYPAMLADVASGRLRPQDLVTGEIGLDDAAAALATMDRQPPTGITVIRP